MSYTPTEWKSGDTVTSAKLNKIENGIATAASGGGGFLLCNATFESDEEYWLDKTWQEIHDAADTGVVVCKVQDPNNENLYQYYTLGGIGIEYEYYIIIWGDGIGPVGGMGTPSANGHPNTGNSRPTRSD